MMPRPLVLLSLAVSSDGFIAEAPGMRSAISSPEAFSMVHEMRSNVDAVLIGSETARIDSPKLTARYKDGSLRPRQPLRAVMGLSADASTLGTGSGWGEAVAFQTRSPHEVLLGLLSLNCSTVMLEGGRRVASAFLQAALVDEVVVSLAPSPLGEGGVPSPLTRRHTSMFEQVDSMRAGVDTVLRLVRRTDQPDTAVQ